ncbi:MAG: preprotein translocase subunit SecA, partial [Clostridia bacterium]
MISIFNENERQVKKLRKQADRIEELAPKYKAMSDLELKGMTATFKEKLAAGAKLNDILADAFAVVREASERVLGMRHFFVQLMGGIALHQGRIAEMGT